MSRHSGRMASIGASDPLPQHLDQRLGEANLQERALGLGKPVDGATAGRHNAVWAKVALPASGSAWTLDVPHALGAVPVSVSLDHVECPPGTEPAHLSVQPQDKEKWTSNFVRLHAVLVGPAMRSNNVAVLLVKGE